MTTTEYHRLSVHLDRIGDSWRWTIITGDGLRGAQCETYHEAAMEAARAVRHHETGEAAMRAPLSDAEQEARRPLRPEVLIDGRADTVHTDLPGARRVKARKA